MHNVRMTTQVFFQTLMAGLVIWIGGTIWYAFEKASEYERFVLWKLGEAAVKGDAVPGVVTPMRFRTPAGQEYWTTPKALLDSNVARQTLDAFETYLIHGAAISGGCTLLVLLWAWFYFTRRGRGLGSNQFVRGARFGTARQCSPSAPMAQI